METLKKVIEAQQLVEQIVEQYKLQDSNAYADAYLAKIQLEIAARLIKQAGDLLSKRQLDKQQLGSISDTQIKVNDSLGNEVQR